MEWLQAIFSSIDEGKRDVYRLPGIKLLELLLVIPHIVATAATETWVWQDAPGLLEPL